MSQIASGISLSDAEFRRIAEIASVEAGLAIPETKKSLVQSRVARRMRALGIGACANYLETLGQNADETELLISALTTNVSHFFREKHHFDHLRDGILKETRQSRLRFWSAGCSNGQEPYSLAMEIIDTIPDHASRDILVLATDIDRVVLDKAKRGLYSENEIEGIPAEYRRKFVQSQPDGSHRISDDVRKLVRFRQLNLNASDWPMKGPFDAIFCRNVVIYFDDTTQSRLWPRFHALLRSNGSLMLGHSERIHPVAGSGFEAVGVTTYRRL